MDKKMQRAYQHKLSESEIHLLVSREGRFIQFECQLLLKSKQIISEHF